VHQRHERVGDVYEFLGYEIFFEKQFGKMKCAIIFALPKRKVLG
jgi:hypothetical protein